MDWDNLRVFLEVARCRQLLAASRRLGVNHATVARRMTQLETQLRAKLLDRRGNGCELTPSGESLLEIAERIETEMLQAQSTVGNADLTLNGHVRVGAPDGFGSYFLAPRFAELAQLHPHLTIQLVPLPHSFSLPKREVDMAITLQRPTEGRIIARKLTDYSLSCYASTSYLAHMPPLTALQDIENHVVVTYVPDLIYSPALNYSDIFRGIEARRFECASVVGQLEVVIAGGGVGILHDFVALRYPGLVRVLPQASFLRTYWLVTHEHVHDLRRVQEVRDFIVGAVEREKDSFIIGR